MPPLSPVDSIESKITKRITELEAAEKDLRMQIGAVLTVLAELRALIAPDAQMSGSPLGEPLPANGKEVHSGSLV